MSGCGSSNSCNVNRNCCQQKLGHNCQNILPYNQWCKPAQVIRAGEVLKGKFLDDTCLRPSFNEFMRPLPKRRYNPKDDENEHFIKAILPTIKKFGFKKRSLLRSQVQNMVRQFTTQSNVTEDGGKILEMNDAEFYLGLIPYFKTQTDARKNEMRILMMDMIYRQMQGKLQDFDANKLEDGNDGMPNCKIYKHVTIVQPFSEKRLSNKGAKNGSKKKKRPSKGSQTSSQKNSLYNDLSNLLFNAFGDKLDKEKNDQSTQSTNGEKETILDIRISVTKGIACPSVSKFTNTVDMLNKIDEDDENKDNSDKVNNDEQNEGDEEGNNEQTDDDEEKNDEQNDGDEEKNDEQNNSEEVEEEINIYEKDDDDYDADDEEEEIIE